VGLFSVMREIKSKQRTDWTLKWWNGAGSYVDLHSPGRWTQSKLRTRGLEVASIAQLKHPTGD
jgi:hypothetical protein